MALGQDGKWLQVATSGQLIATVHNQTRESLKIYGDLNIVH